MLLDKASGSFTRVINIIQSEPLKKVFEKLLAEKL
jgi:hypothetical protein